MKGFYFLFNNKLYYIQFVCIYWEIFSWKVRKLYFVWYWDWINHKMDFILLGGIFSKVIFLSLLLNKIFCNFIIKNWIFFIKWTRKTSLQFSWEIKASNLIYKGKIRLNYWIKNSCFYSLKIFRSISIHIIHREITVNPKKSLHHKKYPPWKSSNKGLKNLFSTIFKNISSALFEKQSR